MRYATLVRCLVSPFCSLVRATALMAIRQNVVCLNPESFPFRGRLVAFVFEDILVSIVGANPFIIASFLPRNPHNKPSKYINVNIFIKHDTCGNRERGCKKDEKEIY